jgi:2-methylcitrate dehydratase PrpD
MIRRVEFYNDPAADAAGADKMRSTVEIKLNDGRVVSGQSDFARGSPQKPMSFKDATRKFMECTIYAKLPEDSARRILATVEGIENIDSMGAAFDGVFG